MRAINAPEIIAPLFLTQGKGIRKQMKHLSTACCISPDLLPFEVGVLKSKKILSLALFEVCSADYPAFKDVLKHSVLPEAISILKKTAPELKIFVDLCLCQYSEEAHCGIAEGNFIDNDKTLEIISEIGLKFAESGADVLMPSGMLDGAVYKLRETLDHHQLSKVSIMNQSAKFASAYYGPFREAAQSHKAKSISKASYQINAANKYEALREIENDLSEGADLIMVKPALSNLDIISTAKKEFNIPLVAFSTSGEYSMLKNYAEHAKLDFQTLAAEALLSIKRAGADMIVSYFNE